MLENAKTKTHKFTDKGKKKKKKKKKSENIRLSTMRANSVPGGTIREGALFFQTVAAGGGGTIQEGALFKRGHYSREYSSSSASSWG